MFEPALGGAIVAGVLKVRVSGLGRKKAGDMVVQLFTLFTGKAMEPVSNRYGGARERSVLPPGEANGPQDVGEWLFMLSHCADRPQRKGVVSQMDQNNYGLFLGFFYGPISGLYFSEKTVGFGAELTE